ncbi:helix-turn-helix domain-containing protein [Streptomyces sp. NPDC056488]|uniref:helix-turn-helix domain-containing protein n=1 Tax=Streptomyces sp. NPDC056488 TaxID=3345836 RepID=UPI0036C1B429
MANPLGDQYNKPVTDEERAEIRRLHAEGKGRNEIARLTGRGLRTISVQAAKMGLEFDITATEEATRARMAQLAAKRALLAEVLLDDALALTEQMWQKATLHSFGGKDHTYERVDIPEPLPADKRSLMSAASAAITQSLRLAPPRDGGGVDEAMSMLGQLAVGLRHAYEQAQAVPDDEGDGDAP